ncbi:sugar ABC transporter substrate-binding protein [Lapillicoccus sp.]|uniref:ABC transporter substrate-binding protein n=1 Tax=Lapillicoccus sp. TaxID=1909287 RepID=UPI003267C283
MAALTPITVNRRRFLGLGAGAVGAGLLTACGGNTGREPSTSSSGSTGGGSALSQWYHQYGEQGTQQAVEGYAKAYPGANVTVQWNPGDYDKKVASALLTSSGPDIFENGNGPSIDMIQAGQVVDMTGILGSAESDFTPSLVSRMTYKGKLYAVPQVTDMQLMVYRKSLLAAAGIQPPTTVDELLAAAKKLTTDKVKGLFAGNDGGVGVLGGPMLWGAGLDYLNEDQTAFGFDGDGAVEGFAKLRTLFTSGSLLLGAPADWSDPSAFTQGLCAMQWTGLWTLPVIEKAFPGDYGVMAWPALGGSGKASVPVGAYGSSVSAKSKNVDAAKSFVKWLWVDQTAKQLDFAQSYGFHIPARKTVAAQADKLKVAPASDAVKFVNENGHAQTPLLWSPKCATAFSDGLTRIVKDGADPAGEIATMKSTVDAELKRLNG